jgi:NADH-quinone oxidoreductase subunit N
MNCSAIYLELAVAALALGILLLDLWTPAETKPKLGYLAALGLAVILGLSFSTAIADAPQTAFAGMFVRDGLALFFKRFFLMAGIFTLIMSVEFAERIRMGVSEFYALTLFALTGMMFAASANDLIMVFVSLELITVTFYILVSFQRSRMGSLEAGVKYLILGALSSAFLIFGVALVFGTTGTTNLDALPAAVKTASANKILWLGLLMILAGVGFKMAAVPFQIWAPDVYQGAPTPVTAFLATGSKAAGVVLFLRVFFIGAPAVTLQWSKLLMVIAAATILYGNLCAIPQRNLKRLLGYSSIANAGYLLMGISVVNAEGASAVLYYLAGYMFTLAAAFTVISIVSKDSEDMNSLAGLSQRSPLLAACLTLAMVSLGGIPPMAGFFGKFLLLKSIITQGPVNPGYYCLAGTALFGVVVSLFYYFSVIRAVYWSKETTDMSPISVSIPARLSLIGCVAGMLYLGVFPGPALAAAEQAVSLLKF